MELSDLLRQVATAFNTLGIDYLVTGSIASMYYGEPRFTNDIDVVAKIERQHVESLRSLFPPEEFYLDEAAIREAIRSHGTFNIIHPASGLKVDVVIPPGDAFNQSRFQRRREVEPASDIKASFAAPEDVIIKKLEFYRQGGSEKHLRDIAAMLRISREQIDRTYVTEWARIIGVSDIWEMILRQVG